MHTSEKKQWGLAEIMRSDSTLHACINCCALRTGLAQDQHQKEWASERLELALDWNNPRAVQALLRYISSCTLDEVHY